MKIEVTDLQEHVKISPVIVRRIAKAALAGLPGCYSVVLVDDEQMTEINAKYLGHNNTTDVISFPFEDATLGRDDCVGEIVVSGQLAASEARKRGITPESELALYIVHGSLHLAGHDDVTSELASAMHAREKEILAELGYDAETLWKPVAGSKRRKR